METNNNSEWTAAKLAEAAPQWQPDVVQARAVLHDRLTPRSYSWKWIATAATTAACLLVLAFPGPRAAAHALWYRIAVTRIDTANVDFHKIPLDTHIDFPGNPKDASDIHEAERIAGFRPYGLPAGTVSGTPTYAVMGTISIVQTIRVGELQAALKNAGATDVSVPAAWDGVRLRADAGPLIITSYPDGANIMQAQAIQLSIPTDFPLEVFASAAFRCTGVSAWEAHSMAARFAANPAYLFGVRSTEMVHMQEVSVRGNTAILIEGEAGSDINELATLIGSDRERIYIVNSRSRELTLKIANALH